MKFTSEDLMKAMGLNVGDKIKVEFAGRRCETYIVKIKDEGVYLQGDEDVSIDYLVNRNYEILPRPKRVGDLKCDDVSLENCNKCPIKSICGICDLGSRNTLYEFLEDYKNHHTESFDQEIYDLLKARLDKEVEE